MTYHKRQIKKGTYGEISKVTEEYEELLDAVEQDNKVMMLVEVSDLLGAIQEFINVQFKGTLTLTDILKMTEATKKAFESGHRKSEQTRPLVGPLKDIHI